MTRPLVSVVMATYNGVKYLQEQIDSILSQDYENFELVVVDDCSKDSTVDILKRYAKKHRNFTIEVSMTNNGVDKTFERGLSLAKGDFIAFSDQDDIFDKDKLSSLVGALEGQPGADMAISDLRLVDSDARPMAASMWEFQRLAPKRGRPFKRLVYWNFATGCAMMFRRRLLERALPFPQDCKGHDWWLAIVAASEKGGGIVLVEKPLVSYRQHGRNVIGAQSGDIGGTLRHARTLEEKIALNEMNLKRVRGYLGRPEVWGVRDLKVIAAAKALYDGYIDGYRAGGLRGLVKRSVELLLRMSFASTRGPMHMASVLVFTVFPGLIDKIKDSRR